MFVLSDSYAKRAYGTSRGFQSRAFKAASSADAWSSVSLQVCIVRGFTVWAILWGWSRLRNQTAPTADTGVFYPPAIALWRGIKKRRATCVARRVVLVLPDRF